MRLSLCLILLLFFASTGAFAAAPTIRVVTIHDPITPVMAGYLQRHLAEAARQSEPLLLVELDTPGGLDAAMRTMVKDLLASPVPVVVYVAPSGARAASAGAVICLAADLCAMAPATNIGAAHPLAIGARIDGVMETKLVNDSEAYVEAIARQRGRNETLARQMVRDSLSLSAERAREGRVIDLVAVDRAALLQELQGRVIDRNGTSMTLQLQGVKVVEARMTRGERLLNFISHPEIAYLLLLVGLLGIFFELATPGVILPGVCGAVSLLLALFAFSTLPVSLVGVLLLVLGLILLIAEIKIVSYGLLTAGGIIAMFFGSLLLFDSPEPWLHLSWGIILPMVLVIAAFFVLVVRKAVAAQHRPPTTGREGLVGEAGTAFSPVAGNGKVFVRAEYWEAKSDAPIAAGERVVVEAVEGMVLKVRKLSPPDPTHPS